MSLDGSPGRAVSAFATRVSADPKRVFGARGKSCESPVEYGFDALEPFDFTEVFGRGMSADPIGARVVREQNAA